jgi:hypothetical protein
MYFGWDAEGALTGIAQIESRISQLRGEVKDKVRAQVKSVYDLLEEGSGPAAAAKVKMLLTNSAFTRAGRSRAYSDAPPPTVFLFSA